MINFPDAKALNPFLITKAVDLNDKQIQALWVDVPGTADEIANLLHPSTPMPSFLLGSKGSGKTHLMRYHSFELQALRSQYAGVDIRETIQKDGYIGLYVKCSGLNSGRFAGKRQASYVWHELFGYYVELWLTRHLLHVAQELNLGLRDGDEAQLCADIVGYFDKIPDENLNTLASIVKFIERTQNELDYEINNCILTGSINISIIATRGKLIFNIPKLLAKRYAFLKDILFVYSVDEFENLSEDQQIIINTLIRDRELPSTLRIGARLYGVKTAKTDSDQEENLPDSEFQNVYLDRIFRQQQKRYSKFCKELTAKRFVAAKEAMLGHDFKGDDIDWSSIFEEVDESWNSPEWSALVSDRPLFDRPHFCRLKENLERVAIKSTTIEKTIKVFSVPEYPLIEKLQILLLYQEVAKGGDYSRSVERIVDLRDVFLKNGPSTSFNQALSHYKSDLVAQLRRENGSKQYYLGLDTFISLSSGLPRALLTILRSAFEWSSFNGEEPLRRNSISKEAQQRGVREASDWFFENMRKAGSDGIAIQTAIDRLARYFRVNRFSDRPTEISLIAFSVADHELSSPAREILQLAENRSFLNRISGGQKDKNSERVTLKLQLNTMLCPRWDLPTGRRGTLAMSAELVESIFCIEKGEEFEMHLRAFRDRLRGAGSKSSRPVDNGPIQEDLF